MTETAASGRVVLGVTGGIAAYKAALLVRQARASGLEVRCALSRSATRFVSPLTLEVLSGHGVVQEEYLEPTPAGGAGAGEEQHVTMARWADLLCVAPATAHTLARLALGLGDDFLTTTALMFEGPMVVAPAMHEAMWQKPSTQDHVAALCERGVVVVGPEEGALASGERGIGRMAEPEAILARILETLREGPLAGRSVLITAGPTYEPIDPVRFLGNRSSGRMGFALAAEAARRGAAVTLVAGPCSLETPKKVRRLDVATALEMKQVVDREAAAADLVIMAAAVADYRPRQQHEQKWKKSAGSLSIELDENPDILAGLELTAPKALRVGFAAETEQLLAHAGEKLTAKKAHLLVANDVSRSDIGFAAADNEVVVLSSTRPPCRLSKKSKEELARELLDLFTTALVERAAEPAIGGAESG